MISTRWRRCGEPTSASSQPHGLLFETSGSWQSMWHVQKLERNLSKPMQNACEMHVKAVESNAKSHVDSLKFAEIYTVDSGLKGI